MKNLVIYLVYLAGIGIVHAQDEVKISSSYQPNTLEVIFNEENLSLLKMLMVNNSVDGLLLERRETSFFAPVNTAFKNSGHNALSIQNKRISQLFIETHMIASKVKLGDAKEFISVAGQKLRITKQGNEYFVNDAKILGVKETSDGIIYFIDQILPAK